MRCYATLLLATFALRIVRGRVPAAQALTLFWSADAAAGCITLKCGCMAHTCSQPCPSHELHSARTGKLRSHSPGSSIQSWAQPFRLHPRPSRGPTTLSAERPAGEPYYSSPAPSLRQGPPHVDDATQARQATFDEVPRSNLLTDLGSRIAPKFGNFSSKTLSRALEKSPRS
ncbi:hypothetical protein V8C35DRAFT_101749 [Trichoderma chlorosporum]